MFSSWGVIFLLDPYDICIAICGPRFRCELSYKVLTLGWFWAVYLSYLILGRKEVQSSRCLVQQMPLRQKTASVLCFPVFPLSLSLWPLNNSYSVASSLTNLKWHFFILLWGIFSCSQWEGQSGSRWPHSKKWNTVYSSCNACNHIPTPGFLKARKT